MWRVSAGNTGALMAMAMFILRTMPGIQRPAIAAIWPTLRGDSIVLDVGATIGADAEQLVDFAIMGEAMARASSALERPTVGLLNIGDEEVKGIEQVKEAGRILRDPRLPIEFYGLRRRRRYRQGHGRCGRDRGFHRQRCAEDGGGHRQAAGDLSALGPQRGRCCRGSGAFLASGAFDALREQAWIRASTTAECFSASTASW